VTGARYRDGGVRIEGRGHNGLKCHRPRCDRKPGGQPDDDSEDGCTEPFRCLHGGHLIR